MIRQAVRERAPLLVSLAGKSGSGKTLSALLMAAGLAGDGKVGFLDTENRRGSLYADSKMVIDALPQGYLIDDLFEPFSPDRYLEKIEAFEKAGCKVLVIDSMTHEWDGHGGCQDIAENNKLGGLPNWAKAKMMHKHMMNGILASNMDIIFCLRAQEKTKIEENSNGKKTFIDMGVLPIQEKNFPFEMILSLLLDEKTHLPEVVKCPEPLAHLYSGEKRLITKADGERLREWADGAKPVEIDADALLEQALGYANGGMEPLLKFWDGLAKAQKAALKPKLDEAKAVAEMADRRNNPENPLLEGDFIDEVTGGKEPQLMG